MVQELIVYYDDPKIEKKEQNLVLVYREKKAVHTEIENKMYL